MKEVFYVMWKEIKTCRITLFPPNRQNCRQLLDIIGIESYDPWAIVKYTHGVMHDDMYWILWEGETYRWEEVCTSERRNS